MESYEQRRLYKKTLMIVMISQMFGGAGLAAGVAVGALLAQDMLGTDSYAGIPAALLTLGSAAAALAVGRLSQRFGRRAGLSAGFIGGGIGAAGVVCAAVIDHVPLLFISLLMYGAGVATNLQTRYAGTDLALPGERARAVSLAMVFTTFGAVAGPNLVHVMGEFALSIGVPALAGPFILAALAYLLAGMTLYLFLRPDPLMVARVIAEGQEAAELERQAVELERRASELERQAVELERRASELERQASELERQASELERQASISGHQASMREHQASEPVRTPDQPRGVNRSIVVGATVMMLTQIVMVAIMTMTPIHMKHHGHGLSEVGLVISIHIAAMFLPSLITGILVDKLGRMFMAYASGVTLLLAGVLAAMAPAESMVALIAALALLGIGWNFGMISSTAQIVDATPAATRAKTQGALDVGVALSGASGGAMSGVIVAESSFAALAWLGAGASLLLIPVMIWSTRNNRANANK